VSHGFAPRMLRTLLLAVALAACTLARAQAPTTAQQQAMRAAAGAARAALVTGPASVSLRRARRGTRTCAGWFTGR